MTYRERLRAITYNACECETNVFICAVCRADCRYEFITPKRIKFCFNCGRGVRLKSAYEALETMAREEKEA